MDIEVLSESEIEQFLSKLPHLRFWSRQHVIQLTFISVGVYGTEHQHEATNRLNKYIFWLNNVMHSDGDNTKEFIEKCNCFLQEYKKEFGNISWIKPSLFIKDFLEDECIKGLKTYIFNPNVFNPDVSYSDLFQETSIYESILGALHTGWIYFSMYYVLPYGYCVLIRDIYLAI